MVNKGKPKRFSRITVLAIVIFILALFLIIRLSFLQIVRGSLYTALASGQHTIYKNLHPTRGEIFVYRQDYPLNKNLYPIATNEERYEVYAVPKDIKNPKILSQAVSQILNLDEPALYAKFLKEDDPYEPVMHYVKEEQVVSLKALEYPGLGFAPEESRLYPEGYIYSHITGFLGIVDDQRVGQYGLEGAIEHILAGVPGEISLETDILGNWIPVSKKSLKQAVNGSDLILTIDNSIQFFACSALKQGIEKYGAESGSIIVMDPKTGAVLALCVYPNFDPNNYSKVKNINIYKNQVTTGSYEPGSIYKAITMAAALDAGAVTPETTYEDKGEVKIDVYTIRNSDLKAHGVQTMLGVLEKSLNTGAIFAMRQLTPEIFRDYVIRFGFGEPTGIELSPESYGNISSLDKGHEIYAATASYGQGITVTPIQMLTSFTPIANQGMLIKPHIIAKIIKPEGQVTKTKPQAPVQVISPETAARISAMLVAVVNNGYSKKAGVPGYYVGGKTGTAQVPEKGKRGYSEDLTIHSFIGFAPVDNPRFIALVKFDYPKNIRFAADSAAPTFGKIAKFILNYYEVPPNE